MHSILLNRFLTTCLIWVVASFLVHELCSLDIWWQLAIGEDILQQLRIPEINIYSAGALGQPYHDSHWLFQVLLAISHRLAGLNGPILGMVAIWGLTLFLVYKESRTVIGTTSTVLITFLVAGASAERFLPRPEIISFLMIALFYSRLRQQKYNTPVEMLLLISLQIIWVNSHGLFVIGPFMVGCYWLMHAIKFMRKEDNSLRPLSTLLALLVASLLVSPYGTGALEYSYLLFQEVGQAAPDHMKGVNELSPTFGAAAMGASAFWFFMVLMVLAPLSAALNYRRLNLANLLIVSALCLAALTGRRNIVLFALVAAPFITENLAPYLSRLAINTKAQKGWQAFIAGGMLLWSGYPLSGAYYLHMEIPARARLGVTPDFFPHGLVGFIKEHDIKGQVYNSNRLVASIFIISSQIASPLSMGAGRSMASPSSRQRNKLYRITATGNSGPPNTGSPMSCCITPRRNPNCWSLPSIKIPNGPWSIMILRPPFLSETTAWDRHSPLSSHHPHGYFRLM